MLSGLYSAATGIISSEKHQQVISENLASLNVPGYRRTTSNFSELIARSQGRPALVGTQVAGLHTDFTPGPLQTTDRPLDVAIDGDGFFVVDGPTGDLYTRNGVMYLTPEGQLVTAEGMPYQGIDGIPPDVAPHQITIDQQGQVTANGQVLGKLEVVDLENKAALKTRGHIYFELSERAQTVEATGRVVQGSRESSNVNATSELILMIAGLRHHEASQRALRSISETVSQHTQNR